MGGSAFSMTSGEMSKEMADFMGMMTLANLFKMAGDAVSADMKYELNEQLNKMKRDLREKVLF